MQCIQQFPLHKVHYLHSGIAWCSNKEIASRVERQVVHYTTVDWEKKKTHTNTNFTRGTDILSLLFKLKSILNKHKNSYITLYRAALHIYLLCQLNHMERLNFMSCDSNMSETKKNIHYVSLQTLSKCFSGDIRPPKGSLRMTCLARERVSWTYTRLHGCKHLLL